MKTIWLIGENDVTAGLIEILADFPYAIVSKSIDALAELERTETQPFVVISVAMHRAYSIEKQIQQATREAGVPYLRAHLYSDRCLVGPWVFPEQTGCIGCAENRLKAVYPHSELWESIRVAQEGVPYASADKPWTPAFLDLVAAMLSAEIIRFERGEALKLHHAVYVSFDWTLEGRIHAFQPDPMCSICRTTLPLDAKERLDLKLTPRIKTNPRSYRLPNPQLSLQNLRAKMVDWRTGLIQHIYRDSYSTIIPMVGAEMPLTYREDPEYTYGRTINFEDAERTAILEALERYAGMTPRGKRTAVRGSYKQVQDEAIHPSAFGLHDPKQMDEPGYNYVPYSDDLEIGWVWAYSWRKQKPVLVPEQLVYYQVQETPEQPTNRFCYETSNGCSMGGSLEEAIYYALLEVIERDSFLIAWYNRLPLQELDLEDVEDVQILLVKDRFAALGYQLHVFDMTMESGIPSIWALAIKSSDEGVKTYSAAGAHKDPEKAILGAMVEVVTSIQIYEHSLPQQREEAAAMVQDGSLVRVMHDHVLLHSHPETVSRFDFLFAEKKQRQSVKDRFKNWYANTPPLDLTEELRELLDRILLHNEDVLIVEETTPELEQIDVKAVKVLVPGMMTMSFGHQYRRIVLDRVQKIPVVMGYRDTPIDEREINLNPHPFP